MPRLVGTKKTKIAIFISGNGSNLKNLIIHSLKKSIAISKTKLDAIFIIKKITRLLDFLTIKSCFLRSIIIYKLLKKYQHTPKLHIGIKKEKNLESHAWIEIDNTSIDTSKGFEIFTTIE